MGDGRRWETGEGGRREKVGDGRRQLMGDGRCKMVGDERIWWEAGAFENLGLQMWWPRCAVVVGHDQVLDERS